MASTNRPLFARGGCSNRLGFTLIEIILVVGLVAIVAAMAWPSFQLMFEAAKLTDAASELRTTIREARRHSINDGVTYRCDYLPGENIVRIVLSTDPFEEEGAMEDGESPQPNPLPGGEGVETDFEPFRARFELPIGLRILTAEEFDAGPQSKEKAELDAGENAAMESDSLGGRAWIPLCDLHPDGSASAATIRLVDSRPMVLQLVVRPLTGEVEIGEASQWNGAEDSQSNEKSSIAQSSPGGSP